MRFAFDIVEIDFETHVVLWVVVLRDYRLILIEIIGLLMRDRVLEWEPIQMKAEGIWFARMDLSSECETKENVDPGTSAPSAARRRIFEMQLRSRRV